MIGAPCPRLLKKKKKNQQFSNSVSQLEFEPYMGFFTSTLFIVALIGVFAMPTVPMQVCQGAVLCPVGL